jgi:hypothetical protein
VTWGNLKDYLSTPEQQESELLQDYQDHYKGEELTKKDLDMIVEHIRAGRSGVTPNEEQWLQIQYSNDLILVQNYIVKRYEEMKEEDSKCNPTANLTRKDFPTLVALM